MRSCCTLHFELSFRTFFLSTPYHAAYYAAHAMHAMLGDIKAFISIIKAFVACARKVFYKGLYNLKYKGVYKGHLFP